MGYRLVTGLYVTNYICLAPELLMTTVADTIYMIGKPHVVQCQKRLPVMHYCGADKKSI